VLCALDSAFVIENTTFRTTESILQDTIQLQNNDIWLHGPVIFQNNTNYLDVSVISLIDSTITVCGYIEFSQNYAESIFMFKCRSISYCSMINVFDNMTIFIINNTIFSFRSLICSNEMSIINTFTHINLIHNAFFNILAPEILTVALMLEIFLLHLKITKLEIQAYII